ncbi:MAG: hypothetical protein RID11_11785 [Roseovarius sp.]|jgi:hypothetical protein|uniref:hypothetical protein n=1 Tax=Roseovarius sp. TaxID=1486281 RepID=UPI0032EBDAB5
MTNLSGETHHDTRRHLNKPIENRTVPLGWLFDNLSQAQVDTVIDALRRGRIESAASVGWLDLHLPFTRTSNKKEPMTDAEWQDHSLNYSHDSDFGTQANLIDSTNERAFVSITLKTSQVNRVLGLTGQGGGQPPKMGPRLYAWLTAWYFNDDLPSDPVELFAILVETPELWENGQIDDARGILAIASFLASLEEFSLRSWPPEGL